MAKHHKKYILGALVAILALGFQVIFSGVTYADSTDKKPIHLQISPYKQKLKLEPGQSYVSSFKILNIGTEKFSYKASVAPYTVTDENYSADYESTTNNYAKMYNWVTFDEKLATGTLAPGTSVDVPFTVTVPKDVPAGGQYAAIMAETSDGSSPDSVITTVNRLAMTLYADIAGETRTGGHIIDNSINSFFFKPPISVTSLVENTGNVETPAIYTVKVWPLGSNETVFSNEEESEQSRSRDIIPDTRRFTTISWDGAPQLGIFTVEQTVQYLGEVSTVKKTVIICPLWLIILMLVIVFILIFWLVSRIAKRHKDKGQKDVETHIG